MSRISLEGQDINIIARMARTVSHLDKMITKSIGEFSLTKPQMDVLFVLKFSNNNELKATEIAEELFVSKANMSGLISRLEKEELIVRGIDPTDSRARTLVLTDKAKNVLDKVIPKYFEMTAEIMSKFSSEEKTKLLEQLEYIESCMSKGGVHDV
ncbi:MarR family winged helix-turn-helix transcriptional regulator [Halobacteriovorax sp. JY17]|uniref:MarR family winged helix-turn-helix transcriptional regulator n=1 Tax=Halobacteriovorax sp. JY17 TaxID=2014617 RepID=UPI000C4280F2|nr:MarR family winged helix-turn-helix transcriptional regulator [Halobacteriovorax sp. JY17]PIK13782.1 MAG: hypothetical protein CES88_12395 [Halobacteriovorax sp. JY17]